MKTSPARAQTFAKRAANAKATAPRIQTAIVPQLIRRADFQKGKQRKCIAAATANTAVIGANGSTVVMMMKSKWQKCKKNNVSGWQRSGPKMSKIQIFKDTMRSYVELIIGPATNNVAHGGALSPYTHNASTEHFKTSSKLPKQRVLEALEYLSIRNFNWEIKTLLSKVFCLGFGNTPPLGSRSLKHLQYLSHGGGYPRWTHIQFRWIQIFLFILFLQF